jgi:hypothetical protein
MTKRQRGMLILAMVAIPIVLVAALANGVQFGFRRVPGVYLALFVPISYFAWFLYRRAHGRSADFVGTRIPPAGDELSDLREWVVIACLVFLLGVAVFGPSFGLQLG